jgi:SAM-dependent methyltransferase
MHLPQPFQSDGWEEIRLDIDDSVNPDILGTITDMSALEDNSCDAVYSSHNIEHVFWHEVPSVIGEFVRVLKPGTGFAIITCPDLQALGERISQGRLDDPIYHSPMGPITPLDILYGHRGAIENGNHYMAHKTGFTGKLMADLLRQHGFEASIVKRQPEALAIWAIGFRWAATTDDIKAYRRDYLP